jgi:hypothetical protein
MGGTTTITLSKSLPTVDVPEATDAAEYEGGDEDEGEDEKDEGEGAEEGEEDEGEGAEEGEEDEPMTGNVPEPTTT